MNRKLISIIAGVLMFGLSQSQSLELGIKKAAYQVYKKHLYAYGLVTNGFSIYQLDFNLHKTDSHFVALPNVTVDGYLMLYADTLHDYLNIYLQKKEKNTVTILRYDAGFKPVAIIDAVEVPRINNSAMFAPGALYYKTSVYSVKKQADTSGMQFFINKHELKSVVKNFEYTQSWQFAFERKYIEQVHLFYADSSRLLCFVTVNGGNKAGEWLISINSKSGKLIKGTRLNDKNEQSHLFYGTHNIDINNRFVYLMGHKFGATQYNAKENKLTIANLPAVCLYYLSIDSMGDVESRQEIKIPITEIKTGVKKTKPAYLLHLNHLRKTGSGNWQVDADIYKSNGEQLCYFYTNSNSFKMTNLEDRLVLEKNTVSANPQLEQFYVNNDKLDLNGKLCVDSVKQFSSLLMKAPTLPVKQAFKTDGLNNATWLLSKQNSKKGSVSFALLAPVKKIYELKAIEEIMKATNARCTVLSETYFVIGNETEAGTLVLKRYSW